MLNVNYGSWHEEAYYTIKMVFSTQILIQNVCTHLNKYLFKCSNSFRCFSAVKADGSATDCNNENNFCPANAECDGTGASGTCSCSSGFTSDGTGLCTGKICTKSYRQKAESLKQWDPLNKKHLSSNVKEFMAMFEYVYSSEVLKTWEITQGTQEASQAIALHRICPPEGYKCWTNS